MAGIEAIRIGMAQINPTVGDLAGNAEKILQFINMAFKMGGDIVAFPELAITGYPPEDLLLKPKFVEDNCLFLKKIARETSRMNITSIIGFVDKSDDIYNAAAVLYRGKVVGIYHKNYLPNYGVFDERRYFKAGIKSPIFTIKGIPVGINICEDIWYPEGPCLAQSMAGAKIIVNINSSPYHTGKWKFRERMVSTRASDNGVFIAYINMVGGQDELVFDGHSMLFNPSGELMVRGKQFEEDLILADLDIRLVDIARLHDPRRRARIASPEVVEEVEMIKVSDARPLQKRQPIKRERVEPLERLAEIYKALCVGTADYVRKNRFEKVVIGLSGGIDSSLVATIAVDSLGRNNVIGVFMPSPYTKEESREDVEGLVKNLGIKLFTIPIESIFKSYIDTLSKEFSGLKKDTTEENIQARIRGNIIMALSNKFGWLVLTTGNKSEMSVGYATLYGDMAGGFAVIKDIPKTLVYDLARYRNSLENKGSPPIPERVLTREPSAELRPDQKDTDTLPPYDILDPILRAYIEEDRSFDEVIAMGFDKKIVERTIRMVDRSEYKRRQAPPGIKITTRAFGKDWRVPITNSFTDSK